MNDNRRPVANPEAVLREEFDDWALVYDPDKNEIFTINPVGVLIWKSLDGKHTKEDIVNELRQNCESMPVDADAYVDKFLAELEKLGLVGYEIKKR